MKKMKKNSVLLSLSLVAILVSVVAINNVALASEEDLWGVDYGKQHPGNYPEALTADESNMEDQGYMQKVQAEDQRKNIENQIAVLKQRLKLLNKQNKHRAQPNS